MEIINTGNMKYLLNLFSVSKRYFVDAYKTDGKFKGLHHYEMMADRRDNIKWMAIYALIWVSVVVIVNVC